ncbi:uncharacterized protein LOC142571829 [Dermacentor variabilis]|uniref:uncharacterized protein LOC142571829 n=1 Tax=Dermacentor variabilis TaxID=34621 RepID=UPI003F5B2F4F
MSQVDAQTGVQYTFGELLDGCRRVAAGLRRLGLRTGDIVGFHCVNSYELMVTMCGTFFAGGVAHLIKTNLAHVRSFVFVPVGVRLVYPCLPPVELGMERRLCSLSEPLHLQYFSWRALCGKVRWGEVIGASAYHISSQAVLPFVTLPSGVYRAPGEVQHQLVDSEPIFVVCDLKDAAKIKKACEGIASVKPTMTILYPTIFHKLDQCPLTEQVDASSLTKVIVGGSTLTSSALRSVVQKLHLPGIMQVYGMTELLGCAVSLTPQLDDVKSVGWPLPFIEIKVVHPESRQTLGPNQQGEICVRGASGFKGYLKNEIKTSEAYENGFVRTGDIGYYSSDGRIFVCGRLKELIKCMDQQVAPAELEELLARDPDVLQVIVVGVPHPQYGEAPRAFVVPRRRLPGPDEEEREADRLKELVAANFAHHKHLYGGLQFMDCLPQTGSYKDSRSALKEMYIKQNGCASKPKRKQKLKAMWSDKGFCSHSNSARRPLSETTMGLRGRLEAAEREVAELKEELGKQAVAQNGTENMVSMHFASTSAYLMKAPLPFTLCWLLSSMGSGFIQ